MLTGETKIDVNYDEIKSIDNTLGYYLVKSNSKYGIINSKQESVIHIEYDKIGIDVSEFPADSIKNPYILYDELIPVCLNQKWGLFNVNGNKMTEAEYDSIGSINTKVKERVVNNAAVIGESGVVVLGKDGKYGGISTRGDMLLPIQFEYIYSVTSGGQTNYYIVINEKDYKALDYINAMKKALGYPVEEDENENLNNTDNQTNTSTQNQDTNNTITNTAENTVSNGDNSNVVNENTTSQNVSTDPEENTSSESTPTVSTITPDLSSENV